jgi:UDP-glucose-4-epimerase GalE
MVSVLVTGGAGYIGSHTAKQLARAGFRPVVLDNLSQGHREAVKWGPLIEGDLADPAAIRRAVEEHEVRAAVHFAASALVEESMRAPRDYFRNNVRNTLNLFDVLLDCDVRNVVFSSTCATYGMPETVPIPEEHPQHPVNPYGESKLFVERVLGWYGPAYGLRWMALRYFNAAGADLEGDLGEEHDPETHLIPRAVGAALGLLPPLKLYGTDYPTPDGTAIRDYIHVTDLAEAHVSAVKYLMAGGASRAINLGTGVGHSVREVLGTVESVCGRKVPVEPAGRRAGDPVSLVARSERATQVLGWSPRYSDLATIVKTAVAWHTSRSSAK